jgi:hypothetical protein
VIIVAISIGIFLYWGGFKSFSAPVQKMYRPYSPIILMKSRDSNMQLRIWHKRNGVTENTIILKETEKFLPRSRGKVISPKIYDVMYIVKNNKRKYFIPVKME